MEHLLQGTSTTSTPLSRHHRLVEEEEEEDTAYESLEATQSERRHSPPDVVTPRSLNPNLESYA